MPNFVAVSIVNAKINLMKNYLFPLAIIATLFLSAFTTYQATQWEIGDGYSIKFYGDNPKEGIFNDFSGDIVFDVDNLAASSFKVVIDAASINTGNGMKNKHAKSDKWFQVVTYPEITFTSTSISKTETGYETVGILDMVGVQKEITLPFTFENNTFAGSMVLNRTDFNLGPTTGMAGKNASRALTVEISVPVTK